MLLAASYFDGSVNLQLVVGGLALGAVYALVALGFVLVFKATDVLNLAHGEFLMLGGYFGVTFVATYSLGFVVSLAVIVVIMAALGLILHYGVMRPKVGQPFFGIVLATIGIATVVRALVLIFYGPAERPRLHSLPDDTFRLGQATIKMVDLIILFHNLAT